jgi:hypothetical protein
MAFRLCLKTAEKKGYTHTQTHIHWMCRSGFTTSATKQIVIMTYFRVAPERDLLSEHKVKWNSLLYDHILEKKYHIKLRTQWAEQVITFPTWLYSIYEHFCVSQTSTYYLYTYTLLCVIWIECINDHVMEGSVHAYIVPNTTERMYRVIHFKLCSSRRHCILHLTEEKHNWVYAEESAECKLFIADGHRINLRKLSTGDAYGSYSQFGYCFKWINL